MESRGRINGEGVGATAGDWESRGMEVKYRPIGSEDPWIEVAENGAHGVGGWS